MSESNPMIRVELVAAGQVVDRCDSMRGDGLEIRVVCDQLAGAFGGADLGPRTLARIEVTADGRLRLYSDSDVTICWLPL